MKQSIQGPSAVVGATATRDFVFFDGELVVESDFVVDVNVSLRVDDDLLERVHRYDLHAAIRLLAKVQA